LLVTGRHQGPFHVCGPEVQTPHALALLVAQHFGLDKALISPTDAQHFVEPAPRPPATDLLTHRMEALGFAGHAFADGLRLMAAQLPA